MTYGKHFLARSLLLTGLMIAAAAPAAAQDITRDADQAPRMEINLAGVDVTTPEGEALARHRISGAARSLCASVPDADGFKLQAAACAHTARQEAYRQLAEMRQTQLAQRIQRGSLMPGASAG